MLTAEQNTTAFLQMINDIVIIAFILKLRVNMLQAKKFDLED